MDANSFMFTDGSLALDGRSNASDARGEWRRDEYPRSAARQNKQSTKLSRHDTEQRKTRTEVSSQSRVSSVTIGGRDAVELGKLLTFYFQPFNIQHIRGLSSTVQEQ